MGWALIEARGKGDSGELLERSLQGWGKQSQDRASWEVSVSRGTPSGGRYVSLSPRFKTQGPQEWERA